MSPQQTYIDNLIAQGESAQLDFKYHVSSARNIAKTLVAFANTRGGKLLLGVKDNGKVVGIESGEERYMIETAARYYCSPVVSFSVRDWLYEGKSLLEIDIPVSHAKPHSVKNEDDKWWVYIRVNDNNKLANRIVMAFLKRRQDERNTYIRYTQKENSLLDYLNTHHSISLDQFRQIAGIKRRQAENTIINLCAIGVLQIHHDERHFYYALNLPENENSPGKVF